MKTISWGANFPPGRKKTKAPRKTGKKRVSDLESQLALKIKVAGLPSPTREFRFDEARQWRFDFCWPELKIACECEGGTWIQGSHTRGKHYESDCIKYNAALLQGYRVFRFTTDMVTDGRAIALLKKVFQSS